MVINNPYNEAMRYIDNAKEQLKLAHKDGDYYIDEKYVKSACGIAYSGAIKALDFFFDIRKVENRRRRKSIEYYRTMLGKMDNKLKDNLNTTYNILHLAGYYDGEKDISVIEAGFKNALTVIAALKPYSKNGDK